MSIGSVIKAIREHYRHEAEKIVWIATNYPNPNIEKHALLEFNSSQIKESTEPLCHERMSQLATHLNQNPDELKAKEYPLNIIKWIRGNLTSEITFDVLGRYFPDSKSIELYWLSIILHAEEKHCSSYDLARIVYVHELSHAMTHLGTDADGRSTNFSWSTDVAEGFAQFYTHYCLKEQTDNALIALFARLLDHQPEPYRKHLKWLPYDDLIYYINEGIIIPEDEIMLQGINGSPPAVTTPFFSSYKESIRKAVLTQGITLDDITELIERENVALDEILNVFV